MVFVVVSGIFWLILSLNEDLQQNFEVDVKIVNVPDSVTFINDAPDAIQVSVRDRGVTLLKRHFMKKALMTIDFKNYANKGVLRLSKTELNSALHSIFGSSAQILSSTIDSLRLNYTTYPGKKVPLIVDATITPSVENVISGDITVSSPEVMIFSSPEILDTITHVYTEHINRKNLTDSTIINIKLRRMSGVKIIPDNVDVIIPVEPLVLKRSIVAITVKNVPANEIITLFPQNVEVNYYQPMSSYNDLSEEPVVQADYHDIYDTLLHKLPIQIVSMPKGCVNATLKTDSVGYTISKKL